MSKEKPFENKLSAFYKKTAIDLLMFGYACGFRRGRPGAQINNSIECFLDDFGLSEGYNLENAQRSFTRIAEDFLWINDPYLKSFIFNIPKGKEKIENIMMRKIKRQLLHYPISKNYL